MYGLTKQSAVSSKSGTYKIKCTEDCCKRRRNSDGAQRQRSYDGTKSFLSKIKFKKNNFGAFHVRIMHAKFQALLVWEENEVNGCMRDVTPDPYTKFINIPPSLWVGLLLSFKF